MQKMLKTEKPLIIVDDRERKSAIAEELKMHDVLLRVSRIDIGDYVLSDRVVVERKSFNDLESSIIDGRLFSQAKELLKYKKPLIIVETGSPSRLHRNAVYGAVSSIILDYGIPVIFMDPPEAATFMYRIAYREQVSEGRHVGIAKKQRIWTDDDARISIVSGFPGISIIRAQSLMDHFKTLHSLFSADESELLKVEGIGPKKAKQMLKIIYGEYKHGGGSNGH